MIEIVTVILLLILFSLVSEEITKVPTTLFLITYAYIITTFFTPIVEVSKDSFDDVLYLMIPIVLLPDLLKISIDEVKQNIYPILYLAIFAVVLSISTATIVTLYLSPYSFSIGALIALFTMLMATDAITVSSIFSNFALPKKLKIYAEGESLLNDVTALIIFYFIALPLLKGGDVSFLEINIIVLKVLTLSIFIGFTMGYLGYLGLKILKDPIEQFIIIYLVGIVSFLTAEHLHISGILSVITSIIVFRIFVDRDLDSNQLSLSDNDSNNFRTLMQNLYKNIPAVTKRELRGYKKESEYIAILANGIIFIIMSHLFDISSLLDYSIEILLVFSLTTILRFISISSMFFVLKKPFHWSLSLTLSGVKGALTLIMVYSLPKDFIHRELFEAIVVGNIILSTFIYTILLIFVIKANSLRFKKDIFLSDEKHSKDFSISTSIKNYIEKDFITKAYNKIFIEEIIEKEIFRVNRYKLNLSLIGLKIYNIQSNKNQCAILEKISSFILTDIRNTDYFGKLDGDYYVILTTNTALNGAISLANKLHREFQDIEDESNVEIHFGVTQITEFDTKDAVLDKIDDAITSKSDYIEIEI